MYPEDRTLAETKLRQAMERPGDARCEYRITWPDGQVRWHHARGRTLADPTVGRSAWSGSRRTSRNGSKRNRVGESEATPLGDPRGRDGLVGLGPAERREALRESETRFRALYEQAPLGIALINSRTGQFLQINPKYREIIQRSEEEMRKLTFQSITHPEDLQADLDNMAGLIEGKSRFFNMEKRLFRGDGSLIWVSLTVVPMWEEGQLPHSHIAIIEDITERRQAEEAIRESEVRMRLLVENTPLAVIEWGPDFRLSRWSIEAERVFGWKAEEVLGRHLDEFRWVHNEDSEAVSQVVAGLIDGTHARSVSCNRNYRKDGSVIYCEWYNSSLRDAAGKLRSVLSLVLDVTDRKLAEKALAAARSAAEQANRAKDHFLAVLSHELRTPLTPVVMGVSMLQDRSDLAPAVRETLEMVSHSIAMEVRLIDDLLDVSRIAREKVELHKQRVELCAVIRQAVEFCKSDIEAHRLHFGVDLGAGVALLGRSRRISAPTGLLEPIEERHQVHAARWLRGHSLPAGPGPGARRGQR